MGKSLNKIMGFNALFDYRRVPLQVAMEVRSQSSRNGTCSVVMLNYYRAVDVLDLGTSCPWTTYCTTTLRKHPGFHLISPFIHQTSQGYMVLSEIQRGT